MLKVENLLKNYGKLEAVKGINFTVRQGEIFGFLGPNGAGKTTTIKCCSGLLKPDSGKVQICGRDITKEPVEAKKILGYVPEDPYLYNRLSGREFLKLISGVYMPQISPAEKERRINDILIEMQLMEKADELIDSYSQGMRRKIALSAAFLHNPEVILLDEPTGGLDAISARNAKNIFRKRADQGGAVLITTHILEIAERICDRIAIIYEGKVIAVGTLAQLQDNAKNDNSSTLEDIFVELTNS